MYHMKIVIYSQQSMCSSVISYALQWLTPFIVFYIIFYAKSKNMHCISSRSDWNTVWTAVALMNLMSFHVKKKITRMTLKFIPNLCEIQLILHSWTELVGKCWIHMFLSSKEWTLLKMVDVETTQHDKIKYNRLKLINCLICLFHWELQSFFDTG